MKLEDPHIINAISYFLDNDIPVSNKLLEYVDKIRDISPKGKVLLLIKDLEKAIEHVEEGAWITNPNVSQYRESLISYKKDFEDFSNFLDNTRNIPIR